jgi:hypothetical protein
LRKLRALAMATKAFRSDRAGSGIAGDPSLVHAIFDG